jgi:formate hydrogenlyase subunit 4
VAIRRVFNLFLKVFLTFSICERVWSSTSSAFTHKTLSLLIIPIMAVVRYSLCKLRMEQADNQGYGVLTMVLRLRA